MATTCHHCWLLPLLLMSFVKWENQQNHRSKSWRKPTTPNHNRMKWKWNGFEYSVVKYKSNKNGCGEMNNNNAYRNIVVLCVLVSVCVAAHRNKWMDPSIFITFLMKRRISIRRMKRRDRKLNSCLLSTHSLRARVSKRLCCRLLKQMRTMKGVVYTTITIALWVNLDSPAHRSNCCVLCVSTSVNIQ